MTKREGLFLAGGALLAWLYRRACSCNAPKWTLPQPGPYEAPINPDLTQQQLGLQPVQPTMTQSIAGAWNPDGAGGATVSPVLDPYPANAVIGS